MDETDLRLCILLATNSRQPYRELADRLGISLQAVHRRVQDLLDSGVIDKFYTVPTERALSAMCVFLYGKSESKTLEETINEMGKDEHVEAVYVAGGNLLFASAFLRDLSELDGLTEFVKTKGLIPDIQIAIPPCNPSDVSSGKPHSVKPLSKLEMKILNSLRNDSRKPTKDIAEEAGVSSKTVKKHLNRMVEDDLIRFTTSWFPSVTGNILSVLRVKIKKDANKTATGATILNEFQPNILSFVPLVNIPDSIFCIVWTPSLKKLTELQRSVEEMDSVESVLTDIIYNVKRFDTWVDSS